VPATEPIRVVHGTPDDEELAALVAVLTHLPSRPPPAPTRSAWGDPAWRGPEVRAGVGAWRMSGLLR